MKPIEAPPAGVIDGSDTEEPDTEQPLSTKKLPEISGYNDANFRTGKSFPPIGQWNNSSCEKFHQFSKQVFFI